MIRYFLELHTYYRNFRSDYSCISSGNLKGKPMKLFKYLAPNRIDVLKNQRIRFTQPASLNDPFEMKPYVESLAEDRVIKELLCVLGEDGLKNGFDSMISSVLDDIRNPPEKPLISFEEECIYNFSLPLYDRKQYSETFINEFVEDMKRRMPEFREAIFSKFNEIGVLSLTAVCNDIPMWAHYAQSNKGFVIEFDGAHDFFTKSTDSDYLFDHLYEVTYSEERPGSCSLFDERLMDDVLFVKSERWKDEREWRLLQPLESGRRLEKEGEVILDDYEQPIYLFSLPPSCITGIIFGSRMSNANKSEMCRILSIADYSHVKRYQAVLDDKKFELNIVAEGEI